MLIFAQIWDSHKSSTRLLSLVVEFFSRVIPKSSADQILVLAQLERINREWKELFFDQKITCNQFQISKCQFPLTHLPIVHCGIVSLKHWTLDNIMVFDECGLPPYQKTHVWPKFLLFKQSILLYMQFEKCKKCKQFIGRCCLHLRCFFKQEPLPYSKTSWILCWIFSDGELKRHRHYTAMPSQYLLIYWLNW